MTIAGALAGNVNTLTALTLDNVQSRLRLVPDDTGVVASFQFLVSLALSASPRIQADDLGSHCIDLTTNPSPLHLAHLLSGRMEDHIQSVEYAELARKAAIDTIGSWIDTHTRQLTLSGEPDTALYIWSKASTASGFCDLSRHYFANFVERYLNYFISREASSHVSTVDERTRLAARLHHHVDSVSHHAFETARITQSFAAGWFNNHALDTVPSSSTVRAFLRISMGKLREELAREARFQ